MVRSDLQYVGSRHIQILERHNGTEVTATTHKAQTNRHRKLLQITITKYDTTPSGLFHQLQASWGTPRIPPPV